MKNENYFLKALVFAFITCMFLSANSFAQVSGTKTIGVDYATISAAVTDLNTNGASGAVVINVPAGYTETAPSGGISLGSATLNGTLAGGASVTIIKSGSGANPVITAYTGGTGTPSTAVQDGIFSLVGADNITIDGIDLAENPANAANPATMEYGYGLFRLSATDGCQNNLIQHCTITLNRVNNATGSGPAFDGSRAINMVASTISAQTTFLTPSITVGTNSNNKFYSNTVQNCNIGIALSGYAAPSPFILGDQGNDVGGTSAATGNIIRNFGGAPSATNPAAGVRTANQWGLNISYNTVNNNDGAGVNHVSILRGIYTQAATSASETIKFNTVTTKVNSTTVPISAIENLAGSTALANTIEISNNLIQNCTNALATSGTWYGIWNNGATPANLVIQNNQLLNNSTAATSGIWYNIYSTGAATTTVNISNNTIDLATFTGATTPSTIYNIYYYTGSAAAVTINNNVFQNFNYTGTTGSPNTTPSGTMYGIYGASGTPATLTIQNNNYNNISLRGSYSFYQMYLPGTLAFTSTISNNFHTGGITRTPSTATSGSIYMTYAYNSSTAPTTSVTNYNDNNWHDVNNALSTGTIYGIFFGGGYTCNVFNNTVNNITTGPGAIYLMYGPYYYQTVSNMYNNSFTNVTMNGTGSGSIYCHYNYQYMTQTMNVYNNTWANIISNTTGGTFFYCMYLYNYYGVTGNYHDNTFRNIGSINPTATGSTLYGAFLYYFGGASGTPATRVFNYYNNRLTDLQESGAGGIVNGIYTYYRYYGNTMNIYNNLVGNLTTPQSTQALAVSGIRLANYDPGDGGDLNTNISFNTVYLSGTSSGSGFGSSSFFMDNYTVGTPYTRVNNYKLTDNIFINNTVPTGAGNSVAHRLGLVSYLSQFHGASNNNIWYQAPGASSFYFHDGTNADASFSAYQARVTTRENASHEENVSFLSTTGSDPNFLKPTGVQTYVEGFGAPVAGITTDYAGTTRNSTTPDIGAWEINGTPPPICSGTPNPGTISGSASVCSGLGTSLSLTGGNSKDQFMAYQWAKSTTPGGPYTNLGTFASQSTGALTVPTYFICTLTCTQPGGGSAATAEKSVGIIALPTVTVSPATALYCGSVPSNYTLTASGANTYTWAPSAGLSGTTGTSVTANPTVTTLYTVTGTQTSTGCVNTATANVIKAPSVSIAASATPTQVCTGNNSQLNALGTLSAINYTVTSIPFNPDPAGLTLTGQMASTGDEPDQTVSLPFNFNFFGSSYAAVTIHGNGQILMGGGNTSADFVYTPPSTFPNTAAPNNWVGFWADLNTTATTGTGSITYGVVGTAPNRKFIAYWNAVNYYFSTPAITYQIELNETSNIIDVFVFSSTAGGNTRILGMEDGTGVNGFAAPGHAPASLWNATNEGWRFAPIPPTFTYAWTPSTYLSATNISNPVATSVTNSITYSVTATSFDGCTASTAVSLVSGPLTANITSNDSISCAGQAVALTANTPSGAGPYTYLWSPGSQTTKTINVAPTSTTTYSVSVQGPCPGALAFASFTQTVEPVPVLSVNPYSVLCYGSATPVTLSATGNGTSYAWSPSTGLDATTGATVHASGLSNNQTYQVVSTLGNCTSTATTNVRVPGPIFLDATATPNAVCSFGVSLLDAQSKTSAAYISSNETPAPVPTPGSGVTTVSALTPTSGTKDNGYWQVALPFRASFYDQGYNNLYIGTNGYVSFPQGYTVSVPTAIPSATSPNGAIFLAWKDWTVASTGTIQYFTAGTAPNRVFVVKYVNVPPVSGTGTLNGQIEINENGNIVLFLATVDASSTKSLGIEAPNGVDFKSFSSRNGIAWTISTPEMWKFTTNGGSLTYAWNPASELVSPNLSSTETNPIDTLPATFNVLVSDTSGCSVSANVTVIEGLNMDVNIQTPQTTICQGTAITLHAQVLGGGPPYTFAWDDGTNAIGSSIDLNVTPAVGDNTYNVTVNDQCTGVPAVGSITIHVNPLPIISVTPPGGGSACGTDSLTLIASGNSISYAWAPSTGLSGVTGNTVKAQPPTLNTSIAYTVTGTSAFGCTNSAVATVKHAFPVTVTASATPTDLCSGGTSQLQATANLSASNYIVSSLNFGDRWTGSLANNGPALGDEGNIDVSLPFNFTFYGNSYTGVTIHSNGQILMGTGNTTANFVYSPPSTGIPTTSAPNNWVGYWVDQEVDVAGSIQYDVVGSAPNRRLVVRVTNVPYYFSSPSNSYQTELWETGAIDVYMINNATTSTLPRQIGIENSTGTLGAFAPGRNYGTWTASNEGWRFEFPSAGLNYAWTPTTFLNNATLKNPIASGVTATTTYSITVTSSDGCVASSSAQVEVKPLIVSSASASVPDVCQNSSVTLTAQGDGGGTPYTYTWKEGATTIGTGQTIVTTPNAIGPHTYTVSITDACGSPAATQNVTVNEVANPVVTASKSGDICANGSVTLTASAAGSNIYVWNPSNTLSSAVGASVTATPPVTTAYVVTATSLTTGCSASAAPLTVYVHLLPQVTATATPNPILLNGNTQLNAAVVQNSNYGYVVASIPFSGRYTGTLPNQGAGTGDEPNTSMPLGFNFNFFGNNYTGVTLHGNGQLLMGLSNTSADFIYSPPTTGIPSASAPNNWIGYWTDQETDATSQVAWGVVGLAPNRKLVVRCTAINYYFSTPANSYQYELNESSNTIDVYMIDNTTTSLNSRELGIENSDGSLGIYAPGRNYGTWTTSNEGWRFSPVTFGAPAFTYSWTPSTYLNSTNIQNPFASNVGAITTYTVSVTNTTTGCTSQPATIQVLAGVTLAVDATSPDTVLCFGETAQLNSVVTGGGVPYTYNWSDGTNDISTNPNISVSPAVTTTYTLTVTDVGNAALSTYITVVVNPLPILTVTPPGGSICNSTTGVTMVATGNSNSYSWTPSTGLSSTTSATVTANPSITTIYTVTGTIFATGCQSKSILTVNKATLAVNATASPYSICYNNSTQLNSTASNALSSYSVASIPFGNMDNSTIANSVPALFDEGDQSVNLGFTFNFFGNSYTGVTIHANGQVLMGASNGGADFIYTPPTSFPNTAAPNNWCGFWSDLENDVFGAISYGVVGSAPNRKLIVRFNNVNYYFSTPAITYQLELNETSNIIDMFVTSSTSGGNQRVLGLENSTGTLGTFAPGRGPGLWNANNEGWRFTPAGGFTYNWTPTTFLSDPSIKNPAATAVTATTIYTLTATEPVSGCQLADTVIVNSIPLPRVTLTGTADICTGTSTNLTFAFTGQAPFTYTYSDGINSYGPLTSNTSTATITVAPSGVAGETFTYTPTSVSDSRCNGTSNELSGSATITLLAHSSIAGLSLSSNKAFNNICSGDNITITLNGITSSSLGEAATWKWYSGTCGGTPVPGSTGKTFITVAPTVNTSYFVRAEGYCNTTACLSLPVVVSTAPPSGNPSFAYTPSVAYAGSQDSIVVTPVPGAVWYRWTTSGNTSLLFDGHAAPYQSLTNKVIVTFVGPSTQGNGIGNYHISMFAGNACGRTNQSNLQIRATVSQPAAINGPNVACVGQTRTYSIAPLVGAKTYAWSFSSGNGTIVGNGTTTVNVTFTSLPATLCVHGVTANNSAGPDQCLTITTNIAVPGPVTGNAAPCQGTTQPYSIAPVVGAVSYQWSTTVAGALASGTTTTGSVSFPVGNFSGNVCVKANSGCGLSPASCMAVVNGAPAPVGTISGPTTGLCGVTSVNFQIPATGDTIYNWGVPAGATIVSGQGTNSILVDFSAGFAGGNITVQASNACGSVSGSLAVTGAPAAPTVSGATAVCGGDAENYTASSPGATSYTFTLDTTLGQIVTLGNPDEVLVLWTAPGGTLSVTASNGCGTSSATSYVVGAGACRLAGDQAMADVLKASVYPNPSNGHMTLQYNSPQKASYMLKFTDLAGRIVYSESLSGVEGMNQHTLDMSTLAKGMYKLSIENEDGQSIVMKVVIE